MCLDFQAYVHNIGQDGSFDVRKQKETRMTRLIKTCCSASVPQQLSLETFADKLLAKDAHYDEPRREVGEQKRFSLLPSKHTML